MIWLYIFLIYSFIGWAYESFICSAVELGRFKNRGFLIGPICPIYGIGSVLCFYFLSSLNSNALIFLSSATIACSVEYFVASLLQRAFGQKYWDYSAYPFQIKGRVCLYGFILFGLCNLLMVKLITPYFLLISTYLSARFLDIGIISLTLIMLIDLFISVMALNATNIKFIFLCEDLRNWSNIFEGEFTGAKSLNQRAKNVNELIKRGESFIKDKI